MNERKTPKQCMACSFGKFWHAAQSPISCFPGRFGAPEVLKERFKRPIADMRQFAERV
ncbi:MAG: hypothetical protein WDN67_03075 [Candidatus Moraniibacteriota bacterium]